MSGFNSANKKHELEDGTGIFSDTGGSVLDLKDLRKLHRAAVNRPEVNWNIN